MQDYYEFYVQDEMSISGCGKKDFENSFLLIIFVGLFSLIV